MFIPRDRVIVLATLAPSPHPRLAPKGESSRQRHHVTFALDTDLIPKATPIVVDISESEEYPELCTQPSPHQLY